MATITIYGFGGILTGDNRDFFHWLEDFSIAPTKVTYKWQHFDLVFKGDGFVGDPKTGVLTAGTIREYSSKGDNSVVISDIEIPATVFIEAVSARNDEDAMKFDRALFAGPDLLIGSDSFNGFRTRGGNDVIEGHGGTDFFKAGGGDDTISGGDDRDRLWGEGGDDVIEGGEGKDEIRGGRGVDTFVFADVTHSTLSSAGRDTLFDFRQSEGDIVDLAGLDANVGKAGNQKFDFIGTDEFSDRPGELRFVVISSKGVFVYADVDGDGRRDFAIKFAHPFKNGFSAFVADDFVL